MLLALLALVKLPSRSLRESQGASESVWSGHDGTVFTVITTEPMGIVRDTLLQMGGSHGNWAPTNNCDTKSYHHLLLVM